MIWSRTVDLPPGATEIVIKNWQISVKTGFSVPLRGLWKNLHLRDILSPVPGRTWSIKNWRNIQVLRNPKSSGTKHLKSSPKNRTHVGPRSLRHPQRRQKMQKNRITFHLQVIMYRFCELHTFIQVITLGKNTAKQKFNWLWWRCLNLMEPQRFTILLYFSLNWNSKKTKTYILK